MHLHWSRANNIHLESITQHLGQEEAPSPSTARGTDSALEDVRPHLTAWGSAQPQVAHMQAECDFYNHIKKKFRIATVQRAIQLPAFSLILGHRQNMPAMN